MNSKMDPWFRGHSFGNCWNRSQKFIFWIDIYLVLNGGCLLREEAKPQVSSCFFSQYFPGIFLVFFPIFLVRHQIQAQSGGLFTQGLWGGGGTPNGLHRIRKNPIQFIRNNSQNSRSIKDLNYFLFAISHRVHLNSNQNISRRKICAKFPNYNSRQPVFPRWRKSRTEFQPLIVRKKERAEQGEHN